ncbi:tripartite tricarboxylate transporter substrate binding protein [Ramlibacter sp. G-1-2-2]|uniref:Tripartite tricarboxylate transporter substrate binding protein n=1 Tax=Ramlibacter agri TaxID=2728837 RepID=A0A848H3L8_9BURK|nr:tripartite tricarboxylate transporter substrate binding protein [Ramlibacter agri]NML44312.1 tripartite tricarboxylate transporter substrate binding protein [Ramlibacter agri]
MKTTLLRSTAALFLAACALVAQAQPQWPARPVRVLVPAPAGSGPDVLCRNVLQRLSERLGQPFLPDNRPGASGHLAGDIVAKAPADGYTLLCGVSSTFVTTPHLMSKLSYDPLKDLQPVDVLARAQLLLVANPGVPADDLPSLVAWIKANPGKVSYASPGVGSNAHLAMEVFKAQAGLDMVHVPYNSPAALTDVASGRVQLMIEPSASAGPFIRDGRLKLIAIASPAPMPEYPKALPANKTVPGFEVIGWGGMFAPAGVPRPIVDKLATEIQQVLAGRDVKDAFGQLGFVPDGMGPEDTRRFIRTEYDHWGQVIKAANIRLE